MKRGQSGLSLVAGIDKPLGISSHDVVNRCRRVFDERRVGHTGTLDPSASGALLVCVGPATRLNPSITDKDKRYLFSIRFGAATDTDDCAGTIIRKERVSSDIFDREYAEKVIADFVGTHNQLPPVYSAIKVNGTRSYKAAREGTVIDLKPRAIEIFDMRLTAIREEEGFTAWEIEAHVSKGTYIRALARDIGNSVGVAAHVGLLRRLRVGLLDVEDCIGLEDLEAGSAVPVVDPVRLLGFPMMFVPDEDVSHIMNGVPIPEDRYQTYRYAHTDSTQTMYSCSPAIMASDQSLVDGEQVSVITGNKLVGLYRFEQENQVLKPQCIFSVGVIRG